MQADKITSFMSAESEDIIMVKIKISSKYQSDVTEMVAKGWGVHVYRDANPSQHFITAEKNNIRFIIRTVDSATGEVKKYVDGECCNTKHFPTDGCGVYGTLYINESSREIDVYAFFRNENIQDLMDFYGIHKVMYVDEDASEDAFSIKLYFENDTEEQTRYYTDGYVQHTVVKNTDDSAQYAHSLNISDATFVYDKDNQTLSIPRKINIDYLYGKLEESMS